MIMVVNNFIVTSKPPSAAAAAEMFLPATSSLLSLELDASQWAVVKGLLNDEFRAASKSELNMMSPALPQR